VHDGHGVWRVDVGIGPVHHRRDGLACVAATVHRRREHPAALGQMLARRVDAADELLEPDLADERAGRFLFDGPAAVAVDGPVAGELEHARPRLAPRERVARDMARDRRIGPERAHRVHIARMGFAQDQPFGFDRRDHHRVYAPRGRIPAA
jgi:hypothetical protein